MDLNLELLLALALVGFLMALPILSRKWQGRVEYVMPFELLKRVEAGEDVVILDIRSERDFARGHIEGAINLARRDLESRISAIEAAAGRREEQPLVVVCQTDFFSIGAAKLLERRGYTNVSVMKGGIFRWKRQRLPLATGN